MELFKYTFEKENLGMKDGEIIELDPTIYECNFALTVKAMGMFEEEYGKPLINVIFADNNNIADETAEIGSPRFIRALACCTYVKLTENEVIQNEATRAEFKELDIYKSCAGDLLFVGRLVKAATSAVHEKVKKQLDDNGKKSKN